MMKDLGWLNDWLGTSREPKEYKDCRALHHPIEDNDVGPPNRGLDHVVKCKVCEIMWHYDSGD